LTSGKTSVGTRISLEHLVPSPVGGVLTITATQVYADGRLVRFSVSARHADGKLVGSGEVTRVVVDAERFLARLG
jgi:fluoroacetyl-CoA thioesterase